MGVVPTRRTARIRKLEFHISLVQFALVLEQSGIDQAINIVRNAHLYRDLNKLPCRKVIVPSEYSFSGVHLCLDNHNL